MKYSRWVFDGDAWILQGSFLFNKNHDEEISVLRLGGYQELVEKWNRNNENIKTGYRYTCHEGGLQIQ